MLTLTIREDFDSEDDALETLETVMDLVKGGFTSGYYPTWSLDIETAKQHEPSPYVATFVPQANQGDYIVPADPRGETEWRVSEAHIERLVGYYMSLDKTDRATVLDALIDGDNYVSDELRHDPAAPRWVREWEGPFEVSMREDLDSKEG